MREGIMKELVNKTNWREAQLFHKSRIKWIAKGVINSNFFHKWVNMRYK